jgi:hypothetical protein
VHEMSAAVSGQIVTADGDYDHRRLTTIYTDHDLPEHDASGQPATLRRSSVDRQCENKAPEALLMETRRTREFDGQLTAFVLSGDEGLGALQVGMLHARVSVLTC